MTIRLGCGSTRSEEIMLHPSGRIKSQKKSSSTLTFYFKEESQQTLETVAIY
ncbi:hypothetical protein [Paenibacillus chitinolyticus]|uniref:hypothetical protein n=1 Tax=Paenibacillus chitinolyticus TaxID=79263 RepID=UPI001C457C6E|nr:hypothetical protein [Paenibacillus chitinolyticus]MBV6717193.1 hypothetical protein [Paenibacillus chitinolyticus]